MTSLYVLAAVGATVLAGTAAVVGFLLVSVHLDKRAATKRRAEQGRVVDAEWLALLAATEPTPVYDQLVCEEIEKAEGWTL